MPNPSGLRGWQLDFAYTEWCGQNLSLSDGATAKAYLTGPTTLPPRPVYCIPPPAAPEPVCMNAPRP